ncbi:MAG: hypothetical protein LAN36_15730 [Acidobacteriia bacterium]|nr:hypothetical protein [Terriglobia bacterium]
MLRRSLLAILLGVLATPLLAQNPATPDFSGTWVFNPAQSQPAKRVANRTETIAIACTGQTIEFHFTTDGKASTQAYLLDGKEHVGRVLGGSAVYGRAEWKGSVLVTKFRTDLFTFKTRWKLSSGGRVLIRSIEGPGHNNQLLVYDKQ